MSVAFDSVESAVDIIRKQLFCVMLISASIAFFLAYLLAEKFSCPIRKLSKQAENLGNEQFSNDFQKGFCMETDELGETFILTNQKLKESKIYQKELLANVSHDLRTPLTMIKGYTESIQDFGENAQQRQADCEIILKETDRLTALVNEILTYSELQENSEKVNAVFLNFSRLVQNVIRQFTPLFQHTGGVIEQHITENIDFYGNEQQLESAVYNLIDNAIRHTSESKKITVILKKENKHISLSVRDYGNGIPQKEIPHIWKRYYTYRQRNKQGVSGLGLAIVKQIVDLHGGFYKVESKIGEGSLFELIFLQNTE